MKSSIFLFALSATVSLISCSKDRDFGHEPHDKNKMMQIMHTMDAKMDTMEMTMDIDHDFSNMMIIHHQTAIDMAEVIVEEGSDSALVRMAEMMIEKQRQEIAELQAFVANHKPHVMNPEQHEELMKTMEKMARQADLQHINGDIQHDFAILMIPHHQSAIDMADIEIHHGHDMIPKDMAMMIKEDQKMEIEELQKWLLTYKK
jgi:uncharacterized protein (DUF305 family)